MKILIVDDHTLIRDALRGVLVALRSDAAVLEASRSSEALEIAAGNQDIELILLDLGLPDSDGFTTLSELRERHPEMAVVVLSASTDREDIARALQLGAQGFIPKSAHRDVMLGALNFIFSGGIYVPPEILVETAATPASNAAIDCRLPPAQDLGLTTRQREVLALMMQGKSNKAICRALDVAEPTVKNHVTAVLKALRATNRTEAVVAAGALMSRLVGKAG
jgi:DNA-binding NarL/FixJ family response regulator